MKYEILFVGGMQWLGRLEDILGTKEFNLTHVNDADEAKSCVGSVRRFGLIICVDTVCPHDRHDGLHLAHQLRKLGHKVLLLSDSDDTKGLEVVTKTEFHHDPVRMMGKIYRLVAAHVRETTVAQ